MISNHKQLSDLLHKCFPDQKQNTTADSDGRELLLSYYPMTNNLDVGLNTAEQILSWDYFFVKVKLRLSPWSSPGGGVVNATCMRFNISTAGVCRAA